MVLSTMKTRIQITKLEALHLLAALNLASETTQETSYQVSNLNLRKKLLKAIDRTHDHKNESCLNQNMD